MLQQSGVINPPLFKSKPFVSSYQKIQSQVSMPLQSTAYTKEHEAFSNISVVAFTQKTDHFQNKSFSNLCVLVSVFISVSESSVVTAEQCKLQTKADMFCSVHILYITEQCERDSAKLQIQRNHHGKDYWIYSCKNAPQ